MTLESFIVRCTFFVWLTFLSVSIDHQETEAWNCQPHRSIDSLGDEDKEDRKWVALPLLATLTWIRVEIVYESVTFLVCLFFCRRSIWFCSCFILYLPSMGLLDQHFHQHFYLHLSYGSRGRLDRSLSSSVLERKCNAICFQILRGHDDPTGMRKEVKNQESALTLQSVWDFEVTKAQTVQLYIWCDVQTPKTSSSFIRNDNRDIWNSLLFFMATIAVRRQQKLVSNDLINLSSKGSQQSITSRR